MSKSGYTGIEEEVYELLKSHFQRPAELNLVMGVSGGPDSLALLRALHKIGAFIQVVHINYKTREQESEADQQLVENICDKLSLPISCYPLDPADITGNFQDWARRQRFAILENAKQRLNADAIALAHHLDDQLETILMKILRGAGPDKWKGMSVWDGLYLRPLLYTPKDAIFAYLDQIHQTYRTDRSNLKTDYARNLLRHELIGSLDSKIPGWKDNLIRVQQYSESENELLEDVVNRIGNPKQGSLERERLLNFSSATQISILLKFIEACYGPSFRQGVSRDQLWDVSGHMVQLPTGKTLNIGQRLRLIRDRERFVLESQTASGNREVDLKVSKEYLEKQDVRIEGRFSIGLQRHLEQTPLEFPGLVLDAEILKWPLLVRNWRYGDRIRPMGMKGSQSVADHLTNNKIAADKKMEAIVLEGFDRTLYAVIFPANKTKWGTVSHFSKCDRSTSRYLTIQLISK